MLPSRKAASLLRAVEAATVPAVVAEVVVAADAEVVAVVVVAAAGTQLENARGRIRTRRDAVITTESGGTIRKWQRSEVPAKYLIVYFGFLRRGVG